jgi:DNA repair exonuclease SbcCD ATPase subunit
VIEDQKSCIEDVRVKNRVLERQKEAIETEIKKVEELLQRRHANEVSDLRDQVEDKIQDISFL